MPNELQMFVFAFDGSTEVHPRPAPAIAANRPTPDADDEPRQKPRPAAPVVHTEAEFVGILNEHADEIAKRLEKEIGRFFRASMSVQAEVRFYEGSLIVEGTIILLGYLGSLAFTAGRKAFEAEFSNVIEIATQRVMQWAFRTFIPHANAEPMRRIEVTAQPSMLAEQPPEPVPAPVATAAPPGSATGVASAMLTPPAPLPRTLYWLAIANTVLLIVVLIELALMWTRTLP
jgi:hypothetical protein